MSNDILEHFIEQYIEGVTGPQVVLSWQGGEPTLRGLDFHRGSTGSSDTLPSSL